MSTGEARNTRAAFVDVKVGELLALLARDYPRQEALLYPERGVRYDFSQLEWLVRRVARGLLSVGIERGDRVAVWATNVPEWVVLQFALAKIGAVLVTVNTSLRNAELEYLLKQSETSTLITISGYRDVDYVATIYDMIPELRGSQENALHSMKLPHLRRVIYIGDEHPGGMIRYDSLLERSETVADDCLDAHLVAQDLDDVINMQYTSGTTGFPKGVMLTHRNIVDNAYWLGEALGYTPADKLCVPVPFFHCFGCVIAVLGAYTHAVPIVPMESFDALRVLQTIEGEKCTAVYGVPTMFIAELEQLDYHSIDLSSLRTGVMAGSLCPETLMRKVMQRMNLTEIIIVYGLTEASPGITATSRTDSIERRTQTVGRALPSVEVKIVDPVTGGHCLPGTAGELCCRGYNVMKGYYNNVAATAEVLDAEGWLRTGDQGVIDGEGYIRITGRIKEIIIRGGENISPREIEDLLRHHPKIADVYVYGIPDPRLGEAVAAAIRLRDSQELTIAEVREYCDGKLARFKIPSEVRFVDGFPMTASGKVQKFKLREAHLREQNEGLSG